MRSLPFQIRCGIGPRRCEYKSEISNRGYLDIGDVAFVSGAFFALVLTQTHVQFVLNIFVGLRTLSR